LSSLARSGDSGSVKTARFPREVAVEVVRREALHEHLVVVSRGPSAPLHADRRVEVLGDRLRRDAADPQQRVAADHGSRAAPEGRAVAILAGADRVVEERLLVAPDGVVLDGVLVGEVVRALDEADLGILEVADERVERVGHRDVVGVEHQHEVAMRARQRGVDVARLRMEVVRARHVDGARQLGQLAHVVAAAVVEQIGRVRVAQRAAAGERREHDLLRLVVGADVDVDRRVADDRRTRDGAPLPREPRERAERPDAVQLRDEQHRERDGARAGAGPADAPRQVHRAPAQRGERERARKALVALEEAPVARARVSPPRRVTDATGDPGGAEHETQPVAGEPANSRIPSDHAE
jgi:hypothetical protein